MRYTLATLLAVPPVRAEYEHSHWQNQHLPPALHELVGGLFLDFLRILITRNDNVIVRPWQGRLSVRINLVLSRPLKTPPELFSRTIFRPPA